MFRFSIRELMLVTLVVALGLGWWMNRQSILSGQSTAREHLRRAKWEAATMKQVLENQGAKLLIDDDGIWVKGRDFELFRRDMYTSD